MNINEIVVKYEYYPRITLNEYTITQYKEQYELGESLPPLVIQKEKHILIDGFHRLEAQKRLGWEETEVELRDIPRAYTEKFINDWDRIKVELLRA